MMYRKRMSSVVGWTRSRSYPGIESAHFLVWPSGAMNLKYVLASCLSWGAGMEDDELQELEQRNTHCTSSVLLVASPNPRNCTAYPTYYHWYYVCTEVSPTGRVQKAICFRYCSWVPLNMLIQFQSCVLASESICTLVLCLGMYALPTV